jgi:hypothetical protein
MPSSFPLSRGAGVHFFDPVTFATSLFHGKPCQYKDDPTLCESISALQASSSSPLSPAPFSDPELPYAVPFNDGYASGSRRIVNNIGYVVLPSSRVAPGPEPRPRDVEAPAARLLCDLLWLLAPAPDLGLASWELQLRKLLARSQDRLDGPYHADLLALGSRVPAPGPGVGGARGNPLEGLLVEAAGDRVPLCLDWRPVAAQMATSGRWAAAPPDPLLGAPARLVRRRGPATNRSPALWAAGDFGPAVGVLAAADKEDVAEAVDARFPQDPLSFVRVHRPFFSLPVRARLRVVRVLCDMALDALAAADAKRGDDLAAEDRPEPAGHEAGTAWWVWGREGTGEVCVCAEQGGEWFPPPCMQQPQKRTRAPLKPVTIAGGKPSGRAVPAPRENSFMGRFLRKGKPAEPAAEPVSSTAATEEPSSSTSAEEAAPRAETPAATAPAAALAATATAAPDDDDDEVTEVAPVALGPSDAAMAALLSGLWDCPPKEDMLAFAGRPFRFAPVAVTPAEGLRLAGQLEAQFGVQRRAAADAEEAPKSAAKLATAEFTARDAVDLIVEVSEEAQALIAQRRRRQELRDRRMAVLSTWGAEGREKRVRASVNYTYSFASEEESEEEEEEAPQGDQGRRGQQRGREAPRRRAGTRKSRRLHADSESEAGAGSGASDVEAAGSPRGGYRGEVISLDSGSDSDVEVAFERMQAYDGLGSAGRGYLSDDDDDVEETFPTAGAARGTDYVVTDSDSDVVEEVLL